MSDTLGGLLEEGSAETRRGVGGGGGGGGSPVLSQEGREGATLGGLLEEGSAETRTGVVVRGDPLQEVETLPHLAGGAGGRHWDRRGVGWRAVLSGNRLVRCLATLRGPWNEERSFRNGCWGVGYRNVRGDLV